MKSENHLNQKISKNLRALKEVHYLKASEKIAVGVSDFLIWYGCSSCAFETKFVKEWPRPKTKLLKHAFSGAQLTFMESVALTGNLAFGGVYVDCDKTLYVIEWNKIPDDGNWKTQDFKDASYPAFDIKSPEEALRMVQHMWSA